MVIILFVFVFKVIVKFGKKTGLEIKTLIIITILNSLKKKRVHIK